MSNCIELFIVIIMECEKVEDSNYWQIEVEVHLDLYISLDMYVWN